MGYFANGTEGAYFREQYCEKCRHYPKDTEREAGKECPVWMAHEFHNYEECNKPDSILHLLIVREKSSCNQTCAMFLEAPTTPLFDSV